MSRLIKFRAFRKYPQSKMYYFSMNDLIFNRFNKQPLIDFEGVRHNIMQYTGLKDKNGVEIYSQDWIKCGETGNVYLVDFRYASFVAVHPPENRSEIEGECKWDTLINIVENYDIEVIGNIHQELLERKE